MQEPYDSPFSGGYGFGANPSGQVLSSGHHSAAVGRSTAMSQGVGRLGAAIQAGQPNIGMNIGNRGMAAALNNVTGQVVPRPGVAPVGVGAINGGRNVAMNALSGRSMAAAVAMNAAQNLGAASTSAARMNLQGPLSGMGNAGGVGYNPSGDLFAMLSKGQGSYLPGGVGMGHAHKLGLDGKGEQLDSSPYDLSEFPALSRLPGMSSSNSSQSDGQHALGSGRLPYSAAAAADAMPTFAGVAAMNFPPLKNQTEFSIQSEDFPALPGFKEHSGDGSLSSLTSQSLQGAYAASVAGSKGLAQSQQYMQLLSQSQQAARAGVPGSSFVGFEQQQGQGQGQPQPPQGQGQQHPQHPSAQQLPGSQLSLNLHGPSQGQQLGGRVSPDSSAPGQQKASSIPDRFGLLGLLSVIRMTDPDLNTLALGTDLTTLGLNLNSPECLYATFGSPWSDGPSRREPELPPCYYLVPPQLKTQHFAKFQLETLFYIFYCMPRDMLQLCAFDELYNREWRYHKAMKLWFLRSASEWVVFDVNAWEKKAWAGPASKDSLEAQFMTREEARSSATVQR
eukprot:tig00020554_g10917.t1